MAILKITAPTLLAMLIVLRDMILNIVHSKTKVILNIHALTVKKQSLLLALVILHFTTNFLLILLLKSG